jgi:pyridoxal phosphate enzyme (YggS family)
VSDFLPTIPLAAADADDVTPRVRERVREVRDRIAAAQARGGHGQDVTLVAVTKTHGPEAVRAAYAAGVLDVGENRIQEAEQKRAALPEVPVRWHLIGHVQRNKARAAVAFDLVHGLDSLRLAEALNEAAHAASRTCDVLVQVNVSGEASKFGLPAAEVPSFAEQLRAFDALRVRGVMTMAPFDADEVVLRRVFAGARACAQAVRAAGHAADVLSMGMSGDFEVAIEEGATHVRLGTILFGAREG